MKQIATIALLLLLLFNFVGYRLMFSVLQNNADKTLVSKLDNNVYNDADLVTITVPLSMPYLTDSKDFERKDGEITLNGKIYHYVKQKVSQGNLVLMCLPDEQKMNLQTAKNDFLQSQTDLQNTSSKKSGESGQVLKLVISDYDKLQTVSFTSYSSEVSKSFTCNSIFALQKGSGIMPEQPPEA